jgi:ribokinase
MPQATSRPVTRQPIAVLGSMNMDLAVTVDHAPQSGQTVTGRRFFQVPGGKGANQAIAASQAGADVTMLGSVGDDGYGDDVVALLADKGVRTEEIVRADVPTGTAHIVIDDSGSNSIVVIPGANGSLSSLTARHREVIARSRTLLLQLELPLPIVVQAAAFARDRGVRVVLTPAPVQPLPPELLRNVDLLVPNEGEALSLSGRTSAWEAAQVLAGHLRAVVVTRGETGSLYRGPTETCEVPAFPVKAVDTTAAGDTFVGALSAKITEGVDTDTAIRWATAAAAIAVQRWGASASMPSHHEVEAFLSASLPPFHPTLKD